MCKACYNAHSLKTDGMQIFVKMLEDERTSISLEVVTSNTVDDVKVKVENKTGIPPDQQLLFVGTKSLEDGYVLSYYNIQAGDTLCLIRRQRGMTLI